jgi:death-on-curing protein
MTDLILYFDVKHAVGVHDWIIDTTGGLHGVIDEGRIESVLEHIRNDDYYPTFEVKMTHLVFSINKNHAFNDGNKRSSLSLGAYFLELNGYDYCVQKFVAEMENVVVWVAEGVVSKELLEKLIVSVVMDDEYPESLKIELLNAVGSE